MRCLCRPLRLNSFLTGNALTCIEFIRTIMIQRIQTIYLLLVVGICVAMFFAPIYNGTGPQIDPLKGPQTIEFKQNEVNANITVVDRSPGSVGRLTVVLNTLDIVIIALTIVAIGLFTSRHAQLRLTRYLILFSLIYVGVLIYTVKQASGLINSTNDHYGIGMSIPFISPILLFLASLGIAKDIKIVKSADRLR